MNLSAVIYAQVSLEKKRQVKKKRHLLALSHYHMHKFANKLSSEPVEDGSESL